MGDSVWEYCEVFGVLPSIRRQASWADRGSVSLIADRWLKDHDMQLSAAAINSASHPLETGLRV